MTGLATEESTATEVLIVGGGLAGLAMAAALGTGGVTTMVVDRARSSDMLRASFDGRTTALAAGSRSVLEATGVWAEIADEAAPILEIRVSDGDAPVFLHYDHAAVGGEPLGHIVENRHLRRGLVARLDALETVHRIDGIGIADIARENDAARARLDDGRRITARLVIAADGAASPTRRAAGIPVTRWRYAQTAIVCTVAHERPHRFVAQERFLPAGPFAILPMTGDRSSIVWTEAEAVAPALLALDDAAFLEELSLRFGDYLGALALEGPRFSYGLALHHAARYTAPRLALIAEAAHAIHPIAGQGLNIGLRDVAALAKSVAQALGAGGDPGAAEVLAGYERRRRADNLLMLAVTDGLNRLFSNEAAPLRLARDAGLAAVDRLPPLKRLFMRHAMGRLGAVPPLMRP